MKSPNWNLTELSVIYFLTFWGYTTKEIKEIAPSFMPDRSPDSIRNTCVDVRKFIGKAKGYVVSNYDLSPTAEHNIRLASKQQYGDNLGIYILDRKEFKPSNIVKKHRTVNKPSETIQPVTFIETPVKEAEQPKEYFKPEPVVVAEPTVLDVMRLAKELDAKEIEYKGIKIKY